MKRLILAGVACLTVLGCDVTGPGDDQQPLEVTARSATTLTLRWPSMGSPDTYTVDYLTGVARCQDFPSHSDILRVTGTTVQLTGLTPSTRYHIHVHLLPHSSDESTNTVFVNTLAAGSAEQAAVPTDYESCD